MDLEATRNVVRAMQVACPGYREWLARAAEAAAAENQSSSGAELVAMVRSMQRTLADVTWDEVEPFLAMLERGDLEMPTFGDVARFLRSQALEHRAKAQKLQREQALRYASEPRFRCLQCRDTGVAHALDPRFVRDLRERFLATGEEEFASTDGGTWWYRTRQWYRGQHGWRYVEYAVACSCCAGDTRAERQQRLDPTAMPVLHGLHFVRETLADWYATHEGGEVVYWDVPEVEDRWHE